MSMTEEEACEIARGRLYAKYGGEKKYRKAMKKAEKEGGLVFRISGKAATELTQQHLDRRPSMRPKYSRR